ncbi:UNVERIFIED_CONTAM: hypothetical protein OHV15_19095, partial [Microbacterium sp. SLM126]
HGKQHHGADQAAAGELFLGKVGVEAVVGVLIVRPARCADAGAGFRAGTATPFGCRVSALAGREQ